MSARALLCISLLFATPAAAQDAASPFVTQLRLPARGVTRDVFAWRDDAGRVSVEASALASFGITVPDGDAQVLLSSIPGLQYEERAAAGAIVITCTSACYEQQRVDLTPDAQQAEIVSATGGYLNYEAEANWVDSDGASIGGIAEAAFFGRWGLIESSFVGQADNETSRLTRLETSWTIDRPREGVRIRLGDAAFASAGGAPVRFAGIQLGRHFALTPSLITYPTPALTGEAETASTVELYVDGALRARGEVAAGPFVIDHAPVVSGGGQAELVVTDILGRQQTITRPFFVDTDMLRKGLSDWSVSAGAERREFGRKNGDYGAGFIAARYRRGITDALTLEGAIEHAEDTTTFQAGAGIATIYSGHVYISRSQNETGGYTTASWLYDARVWSAGIQFDQRDREFQALGQKGDNDFETGVAANVSLNLGDFGGVAFTAAQVNYEDEEDARTLSLSYSPDFGGGAISFRLLHTDREDSELAAGVSISFELGDDASGNASLESDRRGQTYRLSAQRAVTPERLGWRARVSAGAQDRVDVAALARTGLGDSMVQIAYADGDTGLRVRHGGSIGWIESMPFAGRTIEGAFALVDAGAPGVTVTRNRLSAGVTGADGRLLATSLRPYDDNTIAISEDDLPFDRALTTPVRSITPAQGAGVVVRFSDAAQHLIETSVRFSNGNTPARGAVLLRDRDGGRFPIGSDGRVVLSGAAIGDVVRLESSLNCSAVANEDAARDGLQLVCAVAS